MIERYLSQVRVVGPFSEFTPEDLKLLRANFSALVARRLSPLPLLLGQAVKDADIQPEDEVVYVSSMGGVIGMEKYLESFPTPSPFHFQGSVHAGPIQVVLVTRRQSVRNILPFSGGTELLFHALQAAFVSSSPVVHITGGEEQGTWTQPYDIAGETSFAFYFRLVEDPEGASACLTYDPEGAGGSSLLPKDFIQNLARREAVQFGLPGVGSFFLKWL